MSVTIGTGKKMTLEEVVRVAIHRERIALAGSGGVDTKSIQKELKKGVTTSIINEVFVASDIARAGVVCRISSLAQVRQNANLATIQFLIDALNANIVPAFSAYERAGLELVQFMEGKGKCYFSEGESIVDVSEAFAAASLVPIEVSPKAAEEYSTYPVLVIGLGCVAAAASLNMLKMVDCVAALSCEATGCSAASFDAANFEVSRPHRGQMASASNLRLLLDGSKRVGSCPEEKRVATLSVQNTPQVSGPCRDVLLAAAKYVTCSSLFYLLRCRWIFPF
jgi:histidine ammonia-lyase